MSDGKYIKYENNWQTVSNSLPMLEEFEEHEIEDLNALNREVQSVLGSPFDMKHEEALGDGKVFSKEVDLKKYFDLRGLDIK